MRTTVILLSTLIIAADCGAVLAAGPRQTAARFAKEVRIKIDYLLYLPADYTRKEAWPLMLFLHGAGERGSDLNLVKSHGPPKLIEEGKEFPFLVVSPQCPPSRFWEPLELKALLDDLIARYKVDKDRLYVTGLSMGGAGTWSLAASSPARFAALVPISCTGDPSAARRLTHVPIWMFNGARDPGVPVKQAQETVDALKRRGSSIRFTVYPDAGHDAWTETYNNPKLYDWLLKQRRTSAAAIQK